MSAIATSSTFGIIRPKALSAGAGKLWSSAKRSFLPPSGITQPLRAPQVGFELPFEVDRLCELFPAHVRIEGVNRGVHEPVPV